MKKSLIITILISIISLFGLTGSLANYNYEATFNSYINSLQDSLDKQIAILLKKRLDTFINKYGLKEGKEKYIKYLDKVLNIINKASKSEKYKKYSYILNKIKNIINIYKEFLNLYSNNLGNSKINNPSNLRTDKSVVQTKEVANNNIFKLSTNIKTPYQIKKIMESEVEKFGFENNTVFSFLEKEYDKELKDFIQLINKISSTDEKILRKEYKSEIEKVFEESINNAKKYEPNELNPKLHKIDFKELKNIIEKYKKGDFIMSKEEFQSLVDQSDKALNKIKKIKMDIFKKINNILIPVKKIKIGIYNYSYFGDNLKIAILTNKNREECWRNGGDFENNNFGKRQLIEVAANKNPNYFTFYYKYNGKFHLLLYSKSQKCLNKIFGTFPIITKNLSNFKKKVILKKLGADYIINFNYKSPLVMINNNIYFDITKLPIRPRETMHFKESQFLLIDNTDNKSPYNKYPYFPSKDVDKYYKKIIRPTDSFLNNFFGPGIAYTGPEYFVYLGNYKLLKENLYTFMFMINSFLNKFYNNFGISEQEFRVLNDAKTEKNISPKFLYNTAKKTLVDNLLKLYILIYDNKDNFKTLKDIYKFITNNYYYNYKIYSVFTKDNYNRKDNIENNNNANKYLSLNWILDNKNGVCFHFATLLSTISSFYGLPSGIVITDDPDPKKPHSFSLINGKIYDPTGDVAKNTLKYFGKTFITDPKFFTTMSKIFVFYPKEFITNIDKSNKIFTKPSEYHSE